MSMAAPEQTVLWLSDAGALPDGALAAYAAWLGPAERRRAAGFVRPLRRRQFVAGRALLRLALAHVLGTRPEEIRLEEHPGRAPVLVSPAAEAAGFSISHSGRWVACAASANSKVGLDIEVVDPNRDIDALAAQAFDAHQQVWLAGRPAHTRLRDFYSLWSTAEAQFKLGTPAGSRFDLSTPELSIVLCCELAISRAPEVEIRPLNF
jgi:4'-phosphopantetheinyl transferase